MKIKISRFSSLVLLLSLSVMISCVDNTRKNILKESEENLALAKNAFEENYKKKVTSAEPADKIKLESLYTSVVVFNRAVNTAEEKVNAINEDDHNNTLPVSDIMARSPVGDSLFTSLVSFFKTAAFAANNQNSREKIAAREADVIKQQDIQGLKERYFGISSVATASMIFLGLMGINHCSYKIATYISPENYTG
jgi:hypothetical protein